MIDLSKYKNVHCIGIGGIGLSAIAEILISRGYKVTGSDMKESEVTERLRENGAEIFIGHRAENVENADLIVYSAAIAEENPEIVRAKELNIPLAGRAEVLGTLMDEFKTSIAISGTHGKTTTTSMVSLILEHAALKPTILVGGELQEIGGNVKVGHSDYFVTEACEYRDSFLQLRPKIEVILNIDSDHLDYFKDIEHIVKSFDKFAKSVPEDGKIIAYDANPFVDQVINGMSNVITYGYNKDCTYYITDIKFDGEGMPSFHMNHEGKDLGEVKLRIPGEHNILNASAAYACCHELGVDEDVIASTLESYKGTERRFDIIGVTDKGVKVVDDYAHHPTEIKATLSAAENIPHHELWCVFQPHTYTRTLALFDQFADAFEKADVLILADIYAAREKDIYEISSDKLADAIRKEHPGKKVMYMKDFQGIADYVRNNATKGDLVITMGAGDIYKVGKMIME
ncbi:UDP-N-acetylmuramate--L-alanine ligase [Aminicella lysinilytica]|uniref:UDP-N-acetylmuramate--L-alanine ligase n=1 Tax=Aminicella lysinilytica TaxID=433323 RepID=UPI0026E95AC9|nr:UDP-N-acetylmuramate--L-alanine ligase [Aminicella lysinilytica]